MLMYVGFVWTQNALEVFSKLFIRFFLIFTWRDAVKKRVKVTEMFTKKLCEYPHKGFFMIPNR